MDAHGFISVIACAGHLGFARLAWSRRGKSPVAPWLGLLFLDTFVWNFADLAFALSSDPLWHTIDRVFSSLMPAFALHVVVAFVGRARSLRELIALVYVAFFAVALLSGFEVWWQLLLAGGSVTMLLALVLLVRYRQSLSEPVERARTDLIGWAIALGTVFSSTDLWFNEIAGFTAPRLGNLATLIAMALFAVATLRLGLLGGKVPQLLLVYAVFAGALAVVAGVAAVNLLENSWAIGLVSGSALVLVLTASARELGRHAALNRERTRRLSLLGRLSEQLAHDLKNPLAALKGALQFLEAERAAGRSLDAHAEFLQLMLDQVERVGRTVSEYQRLAKVEPVLRRASLNQVVEGVLALGRFATSPNIEVKSELSPSLPECQLDPELIAAALDNLLRNACEALLEGGVVTVRSERVRDHLALRVEDSGVGMHAREIERATDEFYTTKASGTGLGLSFAQRVARAHGGNLELSSEPGKGTSVTIFIPCDQSSSL
ncbi:MAG TPA: ATP-binding protein [Polyangiaceae bacterium]|nr:ATP-binding protein [Polyangiaceae bacterium]